MADLNKNMNNAESNETAPKKAEKANKSEEKTNIFVNAGKWIAKFLKDTKGEMKKYCRFCRKHTMHKESK